MLRRAFTLVEVVLALAILGLAALPRLVSRRPAPGICDANQARTIDRDGRNMRTITVGPWVDFDTRWGR